jgi:hypothetical protein
MNMMKQTCSDAKLARCRELKQCIYSSFASLSSLDTAQLAFQRFLRQIT